MLRCRVTFFFFTQSSINLWKKRGRVATACTMAKVVPHNARLEKTLRDACEQAGISSVGLDVRTMKDLLMHMPSPQATRTVPALHVPPAAAKAKRDAAEANEAATGAEKSPAIVSKQAWCDSERARLPRNAGRDEEVERRWLEKKRRILSGHEFEVNKADTADVVPELLRNGWQIVLEDGETTYFRCPLRSKAGDADAAVESGAKVQAKRHAASPPPPAEVLPSSSETLPPAEVLPSSSETLPPAETLSSSSETLPPAEPAVPSPGHAAAMAALARQAQAQEFAAELPVAPAVISSEATPLAASEPTA